MGNRDHDVPLDRQNLLTIREPHRKFPIGNRSVNYLSTDPGFLKQLAYCRLFECFPRLQLTSGVAQ